LYLGLFERNHVLGFLQCNQKWKTDYVIPAKAGIQGLFKTFHDLDAGSIIQDSDPGPA